MLGRKIFVRRVALGTGRPADHPQVVRFAVETVPESRQVFLMAMATIVRRVQSADRRCRIGNGVGLVTVCANRAFLAFLPCQTMRAEVFPVLQQQQMTGAAHIRRLPVRGRRSLVCDLKYAVIPVAVAATRGVNQARQ